MSLEIRPLTNTKEGGENAVCIPPPAIGDRERSSRSQPYKGGYNAARGLISREITDIFSYFQ